MPVIVYLLSYLYLAFYHGKVWLFGTIVHEGGTYTLLQTVFYASHFLGHIPSLTVIAFLFTGFCLRFFAPPERQFAVHRLWIALAGFLTVCTAGSFVFFGTADTVDFILQQKQGINNPVQGGSWNLHLPSTLSLFFFMPVYLFCAAAVFRKPLANFRNGARFIAAAAMLVPIITVLFNRGSAAPLWEVWTDARYLAHSVRELATFPLTYFPIPLYFFFRQSIQSNTNTNTPRNAVYVVIAAVLFAALFLYQVIIPLGAGIGQLAYKPTFAENGELHVLYLLTSHYFEHVLDTVYFTLVCLLLIELFRLKSGARTT
ncbi:hypothetical protein EHM69_07955 [candidate division KSB1 bacterium]|nr:MAG: hypothetical protein EHM69_07955 [candidate division KSB1 bacterium]